MQTDSIERRKTAARARNQTYLVRYHQWSGEDELEFMDEYRTDWELAHSERYWWKFGFVLVETIDLWPNENKLRRTRRLRNGTVYQDRGH